MASRACRGTQHALLAVVALLLASLCFAVVAAAQEPTPEPPVYEVQPGDTLYSIAERFGTTVEAIVAANGIADPSLIDVGQKLVIPTAQPELVPSSEPAAQLPRPPGAARRDAARAGLSLRYDGLGAARGQSRCTGWAC